MTDVIVRDTALGTAPEHPGDGQPVRRRGRTGFLLHRPGLVLSLLLLGWVALCAVAPGLLTSADPLRGLPAEQLQPPSWQHPFGTDQLGRDVFTRVVHGASLTVQATLIAVGLALAVGGLVGLVAGYVGGWVDAVLMRAVDVVLAIPALLLSLALVTALGFGTVNVAVAVGIAGIAGFARVMRSEVLRVRTSVHVEAVRSLGARWWTTLGRHVLPNAAGPVLVLATLELGTAVLAVSALSFLGYGAPPPEPEWGALVSEGRNYLATSWWLTTLPGLTVAATVLAVNRVARALDGEWARR